MPTLQLTKAQFLRRNFTTLGVRFRAENVRKRKKLPTCKPDPVPAVMRAVIIYLVLTLLQGSSCLPSGIGRAALNRRYTWHFSMQGLPAPAVTCRSRGLLPHVFNLTSRSPVTGTMRQAVIFCGTICERVNAPRLLTGTLPCAVRTFLPLYEQRAMTRLVAAAKIRRLTC